MSDPIPVVDFFAGPGGLGEGFSGYRTNEGLAPYKIALSVEKDLPARTTLRLRSFFRQFGDSSDVPRSYYEYVSGRRQTPWDLASSAEWKKSDKEALCATLGVASDDDRVAAALRNLPLTRRNWVLIGGPPCQAYSLVGRSRNVGVKAYRPEDDDRHFLYRHYLKVLRELRPAAFVLENVKGILSSVVADQAVFGQILRDLSEPTRALGVSRARSVRYRILAAASTAVFEPGMDPEQVDARRFVVKGEEHGLGQARHRVILIGIRSDIGTDVHEPIPGIPALSTGALISDLPALRSGLSRGSDDFAHWVDCVRGNAESLRKPCARLGMIELSDRLLAIARSPDAAFPEYRVAPEGAPSTPKIENRLLRSWFHDRRLVTVLNHQTRGHMKEDLARYLFCATFGEEFQRSPTAGDFPDGLAPAHSSWGTGAFDDRFRVQLRERPSTTITSHIAKDGHYFIHFDPFQCRSLTVREAARLQGFPDNYYFEGNRTQQYVQVGNAVPPPLARLIARKIHRVLES